MFCKTVKVPFFPVNIYIPQELYRRLKSTVPFDIAYTFDSASPFSLPICNYPKRNLYPSELNCYPQINPLSKVNHAWGHPFIEHFRFRKRNNKQIQTKSTTQSWTIDWAKLMVKRRWIIHNPHTTTARKVRAIEESQCKNVHSDWGRSDARVCATQSKTHADEGAKNFLYYEPFKWYTHGPTQAGRKALRMKQIWRTNKINQTKIWQKKILIIKRKKDKKKT